MKNGTSKNTTAIISNSNIGRDYMMDACSHWASGADTDVDELVDTLYGAWCREIDAALDGTGFWHTPGTSELCGPVDSEMEPEEFEQIMSDAFERAAKFDN